MFILAKDDFFMSFCENCGNKLGEYDLYCENCGHKRENSESSYAENVTRKENVQSHDSNIDEHELVKIFITGKKNPSEYFTLNEIRMLKCFHERKNWNWCAFILGSVYLFYRRAYLAGSIAWIISNTIYLWYVSSGGSIMSTICSIISVLLIGRYSNYFIRLKFESLYDKFCEENLNDDKIRSKIAEKGGTSFFTALIPIMLNIGLLYLASYI